jgi:hypothetical protein
MAEPDELDVPDELAVPREVIAESAGDSYWSVAGCGWDGVGAPLAEELAALLAPPIVVGTAARAEVGPPARAEVGPPARAEVGPPARAEVGPRARPSLEFFVYRPEAPVLVPAPPRPPGRHRRRG